MYVISLVLMNHLTCWYQCPLPSDSSQRLILGMFWYTPEMMLCTCNLTCVEVECSTYVTCVCIHVHIDWWCKHGFLCEHFESDGVSVLKWSHSCASYLFGTCYISCCWHSLIKIHNHSTVCVRDIKMLVIHPLSFFARVNVYSCREGLCDCDLVVWRPLPIYPTLSQ